MSPSSLPRTLSTAYDPKRFEDAWYAHWDSEGFFRPSGDHSRPPFCIVIPPPNVTGDLHLGHALTMTVEDAFIRFHRMLGDDTLWIPGTDHAGIPTQYLVERLLAREGVTRNDLGREKMVQEIWNWTHKYHNSIVGSLRRLGASCDWTHERFTLDDGLSTAVRTVFVHLYNKGLIYRGSYMVNWCPRCATAISDLEVDHEEELGALWHVRYQAKDEPGTWIEVATTRPETMLGDTAVAVHPDDPRYRDLVSKLFVLPLVGREIPVVADAAVDPAFGTGAVKVTPAHDPTDHEIGARQTLPSVTVIAPDGTMTKDAGTYAGIAREAARTAVVEALRESGALVKTEPYSHSVARCDRCRTVVEPLVSKQWFVRVQPLAEAGMAAVESGRIRFVPDRFTAVYMNWMRNIHDWCISRQIWWGHRIPVWTCDTCQEQIVAVDTPTACTKCGSEALCQETDVLDTWFSSALWPFSTMGWPEHTPDLARYYPTSVMETGYDIIFHWVSRMIMMGLEFMGDVPFHDVYLHGLVRDEHGAKMSKTKGNAMDPLHVIDTYGSDSLRWALATGNTPGNDSRFSDRKLEASRNFMNKLWNAVRFIIGREVDESVITGEPGLPERWLLSRLSSTIERSTSLLRDYQLGEAARLVQEFVKDDLCDWYIEIAKIRGRESSALLRLTQETLYTAMSASLRLLHPIIPFITEELWQALPERVTRGSSQYDEAPRNESIMLAQWPTATERDERSENAMAVLIDIITAIRVARHEAKTPPGRRLAVYVSMESASSPVARYANIIEELARTEPMTLLPVGATPSEPAMALTLAEATVYLPMSGMVDADAERARLDGEIARSEQQIGRLEQLLGRPGFADRAPAHVVEGERTRLETQRDLLARLLERRKQIT